MPQNPVLPTYSALYAFGDSLSDAGNLSFATSLLGTVTPVSPPYFQEQYVTSNGTFTGNVFSNGPTWVQDLSVALGLGTLAPSLPPGADGTDFAYGGAETGPTPQNANDLEIRLISLPSQIVQFQSAVSHPSANALYTLSIGSNDVLDILSAGSIGAEQQTIDVRAAVTNEIAAVDSLIADGAKNLLVLDVPDLGLTPDVTEGLIDNSDTASAALDSLASNLSAEYNADLISQLDSIAVANAVDVHVVDAYGLIDNAVANRTAYGLTNVTSPVWNGNYTNGNSGTLAATGTLADQYLFWDSLHPTEMGHQAIAALAEEELAGTVTCYVAGTHIATDRGEVMVQQLRVGERVRLAKGGTTPVVWLGHRVVDCRRHPQPLSVWPVRVHEDAFGDRVPHRDLWLSPDHAVLVDDVLTPVKYLINGTTITQEVVDRVVYFHVELPAHSVLLAEGLAAESYLDTGDRYNFSNGGGVVRLFPDFATRAGEASALWDAYGCAPLVIAGAALAGVRQQLEQRAMRLEGAMRIALPQ